MQQFVFFFKEIQENPIKMNFLELKLKILFYLRKYMMFVCSYLKMLFDFTKTLLGGTF